MDTATGREESHDRLTGLGGASLDRLGVDAEAHLGAGGQREPVQGVRLEVLHGVGARWVKDDMLLRGGAGRQRCIRETRRKGRSSEFF